MKLEKVTFGADIEFFIQTRKGEPIPAIGMVGGTKAEPKPLGGGYFIQEDNVAVEFNVPVTKRWNDFADSVQQGFHRCCVALPPVAQPIMAASLEFDPAYMNHPQALEFGCDPDINAYTRSINPKPKSEHKFLRSAGGHVHLGWKNPDMETRFALIKACDVFAALPAVWEDTDKRRRLLYGKAGAMRIKPYGVEHRVLSNYWLHDYNITSSVGVRYDMAVNFISYGHQIEAEDEEIVQMAINQGNEKVAHKLYDKYVKQYNTLNL